MPPSEVYWIVGTITALAGAFGVLYKLRPESTRIFVDSAKVSVELADRQRDDLATELRALREEFNQYRKDTQSRLDELGAELRGEKAEREAAVRRATRAERENKQLRDRVASLEAEVATLKADSRP